MFGGEEELGGTGTEALWSLSLYGLKTQNVPCLEQWGGGSGGPASLCGDIWKKMSLEGSPGIPGSLWLLLPGPEEGRPQG